MNLPLNPSAAQGFQTSAVAYERGRPDYPAAALACLATALRLEPGKLVVELGAGTGKFTHSLLTTGAQVIAVEPVEGMRRKFAELFPKVELRTGTAEVTTLEDASVDAVVAAQAFHWFDGPHALAEIRRILRSGGALGLLWNVRDSAVAWVAELDRILDAHDPGLPRYKSGAWKTVFERNRLFGPLQSESFTYEQVGTVQGLRDRLASISYVADLPDAARLKMLDEVSAMIDRHLGLGPSDRLVTPHRTDVYWSARIG